MPTTIKSVPFSFIRFEDLSNAYCPGQTCYILPAYLKHEAKFQFIVDGYLGDAEKVKLGMNGVSFAPAVYANLLDYKYRADYQVDLNLPFYVSSVVFGPTEIIYNKVFTATEFLQALEDDFGIEAYYEDTYIVFIHPCKQCFKVFSMQDDAELTWEAFDYFWNQGYVQAPDIDLTENSFYYSLLKEDVVADVPLGNSNTFQKITNDCYTSLLTCNCNENAFGFYYNAGQVNQVRLPFYLSRPTHPQKKEVYINSKGVHQTLSAFVEKEYQLQTDWMIELFHECMAIALSHDTIIIKNSNIREKTVQVISSDGYTAEWNNDHELITAPGKGKVRVSSFGYANNNCDTEEDDCTGGCACTKVAFVTNPVLFPDASVGVPYNYSFDISGTPPFLFVPESDIVDPISPGFWMTITIAGHTVTATGTPEAGDEGIDIELAFSIENCGGGDNFISIAQQINVTS